MRIRRLLFALALASMGVPSLLSATPPKGFETDHLVLYQPDPVLRERVPGTSALADYIKRLQAVCTAYFATTATPETLHVIVALKPGKQSRVWFVSSTHAPDDKAREPLRAKLEAVTPLEVRSGPVAFAISGKIAGGDGKDGDEHQPPMPKEWQEAAKSAKDPLLVIPDGILKLIWPDSK
ncbi:MAG TPA: hypothetical protein VF173_14960 [Thermoanaerobaculia bacterium]|nr:hypothetical protein [Thermoanaerobaculia bacterium]